MMSKNMTSEAEAVLFLSLRSSRWESISVGAFRLTTASARVLAKFKFCKGQILVSSFSLPSQD